MELLLRIIGGIFLLGFCIFIHELGHYLAARWRGLKVERFSIGFGPRLFGFRRNGVDYRISLLPIGGYVALPQLAGMQALEGESDTPNQLPRIGYLDRISTLLAGPGFNIFFAIALAFILWGLGRSVSESNLSTTVGYIAEEITNAEGETVPGPALAAGLKPGDRILEIDGNSVSTFSEIFQLIVLGTGRAEDERPLAEILIEREGQTQSILVYPELVSSERIRAIGLSSTDRAVVNTVAENSPAQQASLQPGDEIIAAGGERLFHWRQLIDRVNATGTSELILTVRRGPEEARETLDLPVTPQPVVRTQEGETRMMIGISFANLQTTVHQNPSEIISDVFVVTWRTLKALVNRDSSIGLNQMSGPVGITDALSRTISIGFDQVLFFLILININLAILNLLPIPVLDGGHITFATIDLITGRPIPLNIIASIQGAFMIMLLGLMAYVIFNDISRIVRNVQQEQEFQEAQEQVIEPVFTAPEANDPPAETPPANP